MKFFPEGKKGALSFNTATVRKRSELPEIIRMVAKYNIPAICPWRDQVRKTGVKQTAKMIREEGLELSGYCRGGMFPAEGFENFRANIEDNFKAVEEAAEIGADLLVMVVGSLPENSKDLTGSRKQVCEGLLEVNEFGNKAGVKIAIEPLHPMYAADRSCVNTISQALKICEKANANMGLALDVYHIWWDPDLKEKIEEVGKRIFAFHICDWMRNTNHLLLDRGMMYDGVIQLAEIAKMIFDQGYEGYCEVEIFSDANWWNKDPEETIRVCVERHQRLMEELCDPAK